MVQAEALTLNLAYVEFNVQTNFIGKMNDVLQFAIQ